MAKPRHDSALVRTFAVTFHSPQSVEYPVRGWDQLAYASAGALTVETAAGLWVLPAERALWIPDGVAHRVHAARETALCSIYLPARRARKLPRQCRAVNVSPLLRELILACASHGALLSRKPAHRRLAAVLIDHLQTLPATPLQLPSPRSDRTRRLATALRRDPGSSLASAATDSGTALRTAERLFQEETGMTLGAWFRRLRLQLALEHLAGGASVAEAARACGYNGASAFVAMFRRELGVTPGQYFGRDQRPRKPLGPR